MSLLLTWPEDIHQVKQGWCTRQAVVLSSRWAPQTGIISPSASESRVAESLAGTILVLRPRPSCRTCSVAKSKTS